MIAERTAMAGPVPALVGAGPAPGQSVDPAAAGTASGETAPEAEAVGTVPGGGPVGTDRARCAGQAAP